MEIHSSRTRSRLSRLGRGPLLKPFLWLLALFFIMKTSGTDFASVLRLLDWIAQQ